MNLSQKILAKISLPQKILKLKNILQSSLSLEIRSTPRHPRLGSSREYSLKISREFDDNMKTSLLSHYYM